MYDNVLMQLLMVISNLRYFSSTQKHSFNRYICTLLVLAEPPLKSTLTDDHSGAYFIKIGRVMHTNVNIKN